jgi:biopolymer transport protein TolR
MSRQRKRRKPMSEINVVPYIDVTLVLLIIFMITAPLIQSGVDIDLPQANAKEIVMEDLPPVIISIDMHGQYFIELGGQQADPVEAEQLLLLVAAMLQNKPKTKIYIRGDQAVAYGKVVTVMAALKNAGVPSVGLMTNPDD